MNHSNWEDAEDLYEDWLVTGLSYKEDNNTEFNILKSCLFYFRLTTKEKYHDLFDKNNTEYKQSDEFKKDLDHIAEISHEILNLKESFYRNFDYSDYSICRLDESHSLIRAEDDEALNEDKLDLKVTKHLNEQNDIIIGLMNLDERTYSEIYKSEYPKIMKYVLLNSGRIQDAEDVYQEAFVVIIEKVNADLLDLTSSIGSFLYGIAKNIWLKKLNLTDKFDKYKNQAIDSILDVHDEDFVDFAGEDEKPDNLEIISQSIKKLGKSCQEILKLFYFENKSWDIIAAELGYSSNGSARNQKYKCLEKVRKQINEQV